MRPVLISDRTPWHASADKAVEVLRLDNAEAWVNAIDHWVGLDRKQLKRTRTAALGYAQSYLKTSEALEQNRALFSGVLEQSKEVL